MRAIAIFSILALMLASNQPEFPLGEELNSGMSGGGYTPGGGYNVKVTCKVTKADDTYTYFYSIKNDGKEKILVTWEAISKALYYGHDAETLWEIKPNENVLVILESKDPPVYLNGMLYAYIQEPKKNFEREVKEEDIPDVKIRISKSSSPVYSKSGGGTTAAIPSSFIKKEVQPFGRRQ